ncbi:MAG: hypothetical protein ACK5PD_10285 [Pirellulaceae bacterium]|jgi:hypothetical protein
MVVGPPRRGKAPYWLLIVPAVAGVAAIGWAFAAPQEPRAGRLPLAGEEPVPKPARQVRDFATPSTLAPSLEARRLADRKTDSSEPLERIARRALEAPSIPLENPVNAVIALSAPQMDPPALSNSSSFAVRQESGLAEERNDGTAANLVSNPQMLNPNSSSAIPSESPLWVDPATGAWPIPQTLVRDLEQLRELGRQSPDLVEWVDQVIDLLNRWGRLPSMGDPNGASILASLQQALQSMPSEWIADAEQPESIPLRRAAARANYALARRLEIWDPIYRTASQTSAHLVATTSDDATPSIDRRELGALIEEVNKSLAGTGDQQGWYRWFMMDQLEAIAGGQLSDSEVIRQISKRLKDRSRSASLQGPQKQLLSHPPVANLLSQVARWSTEPVDYRQLIETLEVIERDSTHRYRSVLAQQLDSLRDAEQTLPREIAYSLDKHYRNANLRVSVSQEMLQRFVPENPPMERPVRQRLLGADTSGASRIATKLKVLLQPAKEAWQLDLQLVGNVVSDTSSRRPSATFYNNSEAIVDAQRKIRIDAEGVRVSGSAAIVDSEEQLRGFETSFDSIPLFGNLYRSFMLDQFDSRRPIAQRIMRRTIASQTDSEFDRVLGERIERAETLLRGKWMTPTQNLNLNTDVVSLETTENRLIGRLRVASSQQLAAFTPRPMAPSDALVSMQLHESAMNNALEGLGLTGKTWKLEDLGAHLAKLFQQENWTPPEDMPKDVEVRFTSQRPMTVQFVDGQLQATMRFSELKQGNRLRIENFLIRVAYKPQIRGLGLTLERDSTISVDGPRIGMRDRLPLRVIFERAFADRERFELIPEASGTDKRMADLAVSQCEVRDGWLAMAISPKRSPHVSWLQTHFPILHR